MTSTLVVYGGKGMGKTNFGSVLVEECTKVHLRWCALDPMGVWYGVRHSADGKGPGLSCVILGGPHADLPILPTGGVVAADFVVDEEVNVLIDFSRKPSGELWSIGEKVRFVTDYALRVFQRQGELVDGRRRPPLLQILDEAARYVPQVIPHGNPELARSVGAWEQLAEEGRNVGLGVAFLTQRSARLNKSVAELADAMIAFRTIGPNSLDAVLEWLGEHVEKAHVKELAEQVRALDIGSALVVSPGWLKYEGVAHIRARETFDSSRTIKPGDHGPRIRGKGAQPPDLAKYRVRMAETIEKAKADDPRALKDRIRALEAELRKKPAAAAPATKTQTTTEVRRERVEVAVIKPGEITRFERILDKAARIAGTLSAHDALIGEVRQGIVESAQRVSDALARAQVSTGQKRVVDVVKIAAPAPHVAASAPRPPAPKPVAPTTVSEGLNAAQQRIVDAAAFLETLGIPEPEPTALAFLAKMSATGGYWSNMIGKLRTFGYLNGAPSLHLTDAGRAIAGSPPVTTTEELHAHVFGLLNEAQRRLLRALIDAYPNSLTQAELGERAQMSTTGGYFSNMVGKLRSSGLATPARRGQDAIGAMPVLFVLEGR